MTIMNIALYARLSSDPDGNSRSTDGQLSSLRAIATGRGFTVVAEITDNDLSASKYARKTRPGYARLLRMVTSGEVQAIGVWELSRATRRLDEFAHLRDLCEATGTRIITANGEIDLADDGARLGLGVNALLAEGEARSTSKRVRRATDIAAAAGRPAGKNQYGLQRHYSATKELQKVTLVDEEVSVLRYAAAQVLSGRSVRSLANEFNDQHLPSPRMAIAARLGRSTSLTPWDAPSLRRLLQSPAYAALRVHRGEIVGPADWPAVWDVDYRQRLVTALSSDVKTGWRGGVLRHFLSGVVKCGECGSSLRVISDHGKNASYSCQAHGCFRVAIRKEALEEVVEDLVLRAVVDERLRRRDTGRLTQLRADIATLQNRLDEAVIAYASGQIGLATLSAIEVQLEAGRATLSKEVDLIDGPAVELDLNHITNNWHDLSAERRRAITRLALGKVVVNRSLRRGEPVMARLTFPDLDVAA